jgi:hypothetical protein
MAEKISCRAQSSSNSTAENDDLTIVLCGCVAAEVEVLKK